MKKLAVLVVMFAILAPAFAVQPMREGSYEVRMGTRLDLIHGQKDPNIPFGAGFGYFVRDRILVGGLVNFEKMEWKSYWGVDNVWGLGAYGEYNFDNGTPYIPFAGVSGTFLDGKDRNGTRDMVFVLGLNGGMKFFLADMITLSTQLGLNLAGEDIYNFKRTGGRNDPIAGSGDSWSLALGISACIYF